MEFKIVYKIVAEKDIVPENNEKNEIESKEKYINDRLGKDEWELIAIYKGFAYFKKRKEEAWYEDLIKKDAIRKT